MIIIKWLAVVRQSNSLIRTTRNSLQLPVCVLVGRRRAARGTHHHHARYHALLGGVGGWCWAVRTGAQPPVRSTTY